MDTNELKELDATYTAYLRQKQDEVLATASAIEGKDLSLASFHAQIGGKNRTFADVARDQFPDTETFIGRWLEGVQRKGAKEIQDEIATYGRAYKQRQANRMIRLLQDDTVWDYIRHFLERNFFRYYAERVREKPGQDLWALWFGPNPMAWGLLITPDFRKGQWRTDVSEVRRCNYKYWSIGHVLKEGLIDPSRQEPYKFRSFADLMQFYQSVLKRQSSSRYENAIVERYQEYLDQSLTPEDEPFLVPELRYAGVAHRHLYRLDFAVLNAHTMEFTGFELSPASTHMAIAGMKNRNQGEVNAELAGNWEKEIDKRQRYFDSFGIRVETFTHAHLTDVDACFARISRYLAARPEHQRSMDSVLREIRQM